MKRIQIFRLHIKKIKQLQFFLQNYWRKNHIFVKNKNFLIWQHKKGSFLTYAIAKLQNKIVGIQGYIPQSHYDPRLPNGEIFLGLCRTLENISPSIGLSLFRFIQKNLSKKFIGTSGEWTTSIVNYNKWLGFSIGYMNHYFVTSPYLKKYKIINFKRKLITSIKCNDCKFFEIDEKFLKKKKLYNLFKYQYPKKSSIFIINRYLKHPIYKYNVFLLKKYSEPLAIVIIRKVKIGKASAIRIVDFIGKQNEFSNIGNLIIYLFKKHKSEFIDIYSYGINVKYMEKVGFIDRRKINNLIVPDYYEPFIRKNVNLMYGYMCKYKKKNKIRILKGDGDRDRPNII